MRDYSNFDLTLAGVAAISTGFFLGCANYLRQKAYTVTPNHRLEDEINLFSAKIQEANEQRKVILKGVDQRFQQLDIWKLKRVSSHIFFKPAHIEQVNFINKELQELHQGLVSALANYPKVKISETSHEEDLVQSHRELQEHHSCVCNLAADFFKKFDEYLNFQMINALSEEAEQQFKL